MPKNEWAERFDEQFVNPTKNFKNCVYPSQVKKFIISELTLAYQQGRSEAIKECVDMLVGRISQ